MSRKMRAVAFARSWRPAPHAVVAEEARRLLPGSSAFVHGDSFKLSPEKYRGTVAQFRTRLSREPDAKEAPRVSHP